MIEFKPEYSRKTIIGYVVSLSLSVMAIYLFIDSGYKEFKLLAFPLLMIVYIIVFTKYVLIKNIIFDDSIHIERFLLTYSSKWAHINIFISDMGPFLIYYYLLIKGNAITSFMV